MINCNTSIGNPEYKAGSPNRVALVFPVLLFYILY